MTPRGEPYIPPLKRINYRSDLRIIKKAPPSEKRRIYGRRLGRPLNPARQKAIDELLPRLSYLEEVLQHSTPFDPRTDFSPTTEKLICEIGFGDGDHLAGMMHQYDDKTAFIGAEPYINGMSAFLKQLQEENLDQRRIKVWMDDAIRLLEKFTDHCLDAIYVLNPDPWPKARHHKRRIISQENLDLFARLLKPGADLIMTTDVDDLAAWMVTEASNHPDFLWTAKSRLDWRELPKDWIKTKYELKGKAAGRQQTYLLFKRH